MLKKIIKKSISYLILASLCINLYATNICAEEIYDIQNIDNEYIEDINTDNQSVNPQETKDNFDIITSSENFDIPDDDTIQQGTSSNKILNETISNDTINNNQPEEQSKQNTENEISDNDISLSDNNIEYEPDSIIIQAKPTQTERYADRHDDESEILFNPDNLKGETILISSEDKTTEELLDEYSKLSYVYDVEPNYVLHTYGTTSPDFTDFQHQLYNETYGMLAGKSNTSTNDNHKFVVAVLDTGTDLDHEDLKDHLWDDGLNYPTLTALGGGKYGYTPCSKNTSNVPYDSTTPEDDAGHGTHCAGIIAAQCNNYGINGVSDNVEIMTIKVGNDDGKISLSEAIKGINYVTEAKKAGVDIRAINCSWGGGTIQSVVSALKQLGDLGVLCVFASGNEGKSIDGTNYMCEKMANYENAIIVGSTGIDGKFSSFSNYSSTKIDVAAIGEGIWSTVPTGICDTATDTNYVKKLYCSDFSKALAGTQGYYVNDIAVTSLGSTSPISMKALSPATKKFAYMQTNSEYNVSSSEPKYFTFMARDISDTNNGIGFTIQIPTTAYDSNNKRIYKKIQADFGFQNGWTPFTFKLPSDTDYSRCSVGIYAYGCDANSWSIDYGQVEIKSMMFTNSSTPYGPMSGTSMAAPAVTGEALALLNKFPNESVHTIKTRITTGVKQTDSLNGYVRTKGICNLKLAENAFNTPAVSSIAVSYDGNSATFNGNYFGNSKGNIKINDIICTVKSWNNNKIIIYLPDDYELSNKIKFEIYNSDNLGGTYEMSYTKEEPPYIPVTNISMTPTQLSLKLGLSSQLSAVVTPSNATNKNISYSKEGDSVTVDANGKIKAVAYGETIVKATSLDNLQKFATCRVIVPKPVSAIQCNDNNLQLNINNTYQLTASATPSDATNRTLKYEVSSGTSVTVSSTGLIKAVGYGDSVIKISTTDGTNLEKTVNVHVIKRVTSLSLDRNNIRVGINGTATLRANVYPEDADNTSVIWSVTSGDSVFVQNGKITPVKNGTSTVQARSTDGGYTDECIVTVFTPTTHVNSVKVIPKTLKMEIGDTHKLQAEVLPDNADNKDIEWSANNERIVINNNGDIVAIAEGTVTAYVTSLDNGLTDMCTITITKHQEEQNDNQNNIPEKKPIKLSQREFSVHEWESYTLKVISNSNITSWEADNNISITKKSNNSCTFYANNQGKSQLVAKDESGNTAICNITILESPYSKENVSFIDEDGEKIPLDIFVTKEVKYTGKKHLDTKSTKKNVSKDIEIKYSMDLNELGLKATYSFKNNKKISTKSPAKVTITLKKNKKLNKQQKKQLNIMNKWLKKHPFIFNITKETT